MPKLIKVEIERFYLPSTKDAPNEEDRGWVDIKNKATGGDVLAAGFGTDNLSRTAGLIASLVTDWNFFDEDGNKEPITPATVALLPPEDFGEVAIKVKGIVDRSAESKLPQGEKKTTSTSILTPSTPVVPTAVASNPQ